MGLDDFQTSSGSRTTRTYNNQSDENDSEDEPFKVVGSGSKKKVFRTEEDWERAVDFLQDEMGMNPQEVLSMNESKRHDILHLAILERDGMHKTPFHPTRSCIVCGEQFTFPNNWNFTRFKGEPACPDHTIGQVVQAYNDINTVYG